MVSLWIIAQPIVETRPGAAASPSVIGTAARDGKPQPSFARKESTT
jgi:hypothetical protein